MSIDRVSAQRTSFMSYGGLPWFRITAGSVGSGCAQGNDLNQPLEFGLVLASVIMPSGAMSWMMSSCLLTWAITFLSLGPGLTYMANFGPGMPNLATDVRCQSSRRCHKYQSPWGSKSLSV